jgi:hypothetical protein
MKLVDPGYFKKFFEKAEHGQLTWRDGLIEKSAPVQIIQYKWINEIKMRNYPAAIDSLLWNASKSINIDQKKVLISN